MVIAYCHLALGLVGSGHGSLISSKMWVGLGRVRVCVGRVRSKKLTRVQLYLRTGTRHSQTVDWKTAL